MVVAVAQPHFLTLLKKKDLTIHSHRRKTRLIKSNVKCLYLKILTRKGTLQQVFVWLRSPLLLGFVWGGKAILKVMNLVRNRILNSRRKGSPTQLDTPAPHTVCISYTVLWLWEGGRGGWVRWTSREKVRGVIVPYTHDPGDIRRCRLFGSVVDPWPVSTDSEPDPHQWLTDPDPTFFVSG